MAALMKKINAGKTNTVNRSAVQTFDGYDKHEQYKYNVFYDFGDYVSQYCADEALLSQFNALLGKMVIANVFTPQFNSAYFDVKVVNGKLVLEMRDIKTCSGITCSDLCTEKSDEWKQTGWYAATH